MSSAQLANPPCNRFDRMEWAGAFGDLGTLIPFVVAYVAIVKMDPVGVLLSMGVTQIACGLYYRTPFPVQPMKAIGVAAAAQAAQSAVITPATVQGAALATGLIWLALGLTGATRVFARWVPRFVMTGVVLGLGLSFMLEGIKLMAEGWLIGSVGLFGTVALLRNQRVPAMLLLLLFGAGCGLALNPSLFEGLMAVRPHLGIPHLSFNVSMHDLALGMLLLALPQLPLTLGNAIIAVSRENNRLFPARPVNEDGLARSTGLMNIAAALFGGVPVCHGAGGMAAHVAFGARTGGAPIVLGLSLVVLALCFSGSIVTIFALVPHPVLGVVLLLTGGQLALGSGELSEDRTEKMICLMTAAFSIWNVGVAFIAGLSLALLRRHGRLMA